VKSSESCTVFTHPGRNTVCILGY